MYHTNVLKGGTGLCGTQAFSISLDYRLPGLKSVYQGQCSVPLTEHLLRTQLSDYITRGGHIHVATDHQDQVVGWASILIHPLSQLLENIYPVERIIISEELAFEEQRAVAKALIRELIADADATLSQRFDDAWIMVTLPIASVESSQALFTELAAAGFAGTGRAGLTTFILWRERNAISAVQTAA